MPYFSWVTKRQTGMRTDRPGTMLFCFRPFIIANICLSKILLALLTAGSASANVGAVENALVINGRQLTMAKPVKCIGSHRSGKELAKYLIQYDATHDPKENSTDETPWAPNEIQAIKKGLVEDGFHYPDGQDSVVTWMDFDGDGICDFTASAGIGGMKSVDRMFLFRGLPRGEFRLVDAYRNYIEGSTVVVPYIPLTVSGENRPVLASQDTMMQWQNKLKEFATCESIKYGLQVSEHRAAASVLVRLCPQAWNIYDWAAKQLPNQNEIPY